MAFGKQKIKNYLENYPRTRITVGRLYHVIDFYRINKKRAKMYEKQLRLYRYFEEVYGKELDFLRARIFEMEELLSSRGCEFDRLFPAANEFPTDLADAPRDRARIHSKHYESKNRWAGMTASQRLYMESSCLNRLNALSRSTGISTHFPELYLVDPQSSTVEMSYCGPSLDQIEHQAGVVVNDVENQIETIVCQMEAAGVCHLDLRDDGKNLCVDPGGKLILIDFDIATIEGHVPFSAQLLERYQEATSYPGGYRRWATDKLCAMLDRHQEKLTLL